jgi:hypothetical protein
MTAAPPSTLLQKPRYVLVSRLDRGEVALQSSIAASHPAVAGRLVDMEPTAEGLHHVLVRLSGRPVGVIAIPYASCADDIDAAWRKRIATDVEVLRNKGFHIYAAAGNFGKACAPGRASAVFPADVRGVCAVGTQQHPSQSGAYAALDSGYASPAKAASVSSSAATGNAAFRGRPLIVLENRSDCGM